MTIPLPTDLRHQRFADLLVRGSSLVDAYLGAGFKCQRKSADANAKRLRKRPQVAAYLAAIQAQAASSSVLSVAEKREFFARIVRVPLTHINPEDKADPNNDLIKKFTKKVVREGSGEKAEEFEVITLEKLDPLKAIDLDNKLSGDDPEANSIQQLAAAIASLGEAPSHYDDRM